MLVNGRAVAKPAQVADIGKHSGGERRVHKARAQLFTKQILVANVGGDALPLPDKGRLTQGAPVEVAKGDVHQPGEPLEQRGYEFAKGHQMVFVITPDCCSARVERDNGIGIARCVVAQGDAREQGAVALGHLPGQHIPVTGRQFLRQKGNGGLGCQHQIDLLAMHLLGVPVQRNRNTGTAVELFVLGNIALQQGHGQGACGACGWQGRDEQTGQQQHHQAAALPPARLVDERQRRSTPGRQSAHSVDTQHRYPQRQRPLGMGIGHGAPAKAGEPGATRHLRQGPERGEGGRGQRRLEYAQPPVKCNCCGVIECQ